MRIWSCFFAMPRKASSTIGSRSWNLRRRTVRIVPCDVLVIGGGSAALRAAIAAKEANPGLRVALATKGRLGKSGVTANACSDRMAFHAVLDHTEPGGADAWKYHADDIYRIGGMVSDRKPGGGAGQGRQGGLSAISMRWACRLSKRTVWPISSSPTARSSPGPATPGRRRRSISKKRSCGNSGRWPSTYLSLPQYINCSSEREAIAGALALNTREKAH